MDNKKIPMLGIGVTSYHRPEHLELCLQQIQQFTSNYRLVVVKDVLGINHAKNECLDKLKDCQHIVLFDDDCFPIKKGWENILIDSNVNHLLYCTPEHGIREKIRDNIYAYHNCAGCMVYVRNNPECSEIRYPKDYMQYGFEHAAFSFSFYKSRLIPHPYISISNMNEYIHSLDINGVSDFKIKHRSSVDIDNVIESVNHNFKLFTKNIYENSL